jgi:hypothetical protein
MYEVNEYRISLFSWFGFPGENYMCIFHCIFFFSFIENMFVVNNCTRLKATLIPQDNMTTPVLNIDFHIACLFQKKQGKILVMNHILENPYDKAIFSFRNPIILWVVRDFVSPLCGITKEMMFRVP